MSQVWQEPYVNLFKHYGVGEWQNCIKEGDVTKVMDRTVKGSVYRICGSLPSGNYIHFPKSFTTSLDLHGHLLYVLFKPMVGKYFSIHLDVVAGDGTTVRISLSNIFSTFKVTSTWIQFPVVFKPLKGSLDEVTFMQSNVKEKCGVVPVSACWTLLVFDMRYTFATYINKHFSHLKNIRLCSSMFIKNVFTSSINYHPGLNISLARKTGMLASGIIPLPREMSFPLEKDNDWHAKYTYLRLPDSSHIASGWNGKNIRSNSVASQSVNKVDIKLKKARADNKDEKSAAESSCYSQPKTDYNLNVKMLTKVGDEKTAFHSNVKFFFETTKDFSPLPEVMQVAEGIGIDIYTSPHIRVKHKHGPKDESLKSHQVKNEIKTQSLTPDPVLQLYKVIGFGGGTYKNAFWTEDGCDVIYPCHSLIIIHNILSGKQSFLLGHFNKISALATSPGCKLLVSAETGNDSSVRIWKLKSRRCMAVLQTNVNDVSILSFSLNCETMALVGRDVRSKQVIYIWNVSNISRDGKVLLISKAHTDFNGIGISKLMFTSFDNHKLISCGLNNIRVWRLKPSSLRSSPVELGKFSAVHFTDFVSRRCESVPEDIKSNLSFFFATTSGSVYEVDYSSLKLLKIHTLFGLNDEVVALNTISMTDKFFVIGSSDNHLKIWSLDFKTVLMDATHDYPLAVVSISKDGNQILAGTDSGTLGILNVASLTYTTLTRSHTSDVISFSFENMCNHIASISYDNCIKLWDSKTYNLIYEFNEENESPLSICCHPCKPEFVCGFQSGATRVFSLVTTSLLLELHEHYDGVSHVLFSPSGEFLYTSCMKGNLVLHDASTQLYTNLRNIPEVVRKNGMKNGGTFIAIDDQGDRLAVIGPTTSLVTIFVARTLDELLQIDLSSVENKKRHQVVEAQIVHFSPSSVGHLLVATSLACLLKIDISTGQLLNEVLNIHPTALTSLSCCPNGNYLATAAAGIIKIWDYEMKNSQVFVGHSNSINAMQFSQDNHALISAGETLFVWKLLGFLEKENEDEKSSVKEGSIENKNSFQLFHQVCKKDFDPRDEQLQVTPLKSDNTLDTISIYSDEKEQFDRLLPNPAKKHAVHDKVNNNRNYHDTHEDLLVNDMKPKNIVDINDNMNVDFQVCNNSNISCQIDETAHRLQTYYAVPKVLAHYKSRKKMSVLAKKHYAPPKNHAGMKLLANIGCSGIARKNICWHPPTGLFAYTMGSLLVLEDLNCNNQHLFLNHSEEISTLAVKHDGKLLATAGCYSPDVMCARICLWKISKVPECLKVLDSHKSNIVAMEFSRDDQFLLTIGDYSECLVMIWNANNFLCLETFKTIYPIHSAQWHPYIADQFVSVGQKSSVTFWDVKEEKNKITLQCVQGLVPKAVFLPKVQYEDMTAVSYADRDWLYTATAHGVVCLWNNLNKTCTNHWRADSLEIVLLVAGCGKLVTGGASKILRQWSLRSDEIVLEQESDLEAPIISSVFDDCLEMGVVGTSDGTIWCVNLNEEDYIQIVSSHKDKITDLSVCRGEENFMASTSIDGSLRLWNLDTREKIAQFLVLGQEAICVDFIPQVVSEDDTSKNLSKNTPQNYAARDLPSQCVVGYCDGTVRKFDFGQMEMVLKIKLYKSDVTQVLCSPDGDHVTSGSSDGLLTISNLLTGLSLRVVTEHRGAKICNLRKQFTSKFSSSHLWLASSIDCRISIWKSDWIIDECELIDWITFPSNITRTHTKTSYPCLAEFAHHNDDVVVYTGFSVITEICLYSLSAKQILRTISLNCWALSMDISYDGNLLAAGLSNRIVKLIDTDEGTFQDFVAHSDAVTNVTFGYKKLLTSAHTELFIWETFL